MNYNEFFTLKSQSVYEITIFCLKMMLKSGLEKIFWKSLHARSMYVIFVTEFVVLGKNLPSFEVKENVFQSFFCLKY